ncbi:MAG TPA: neutral/alkaline non-lysosomal ceramidase N-terminal domain-containing protein [Bacillota bacterium]|nr:neutral/alkaline non-lysosomal ceramidase N-terminal domain-containing protein [Bacillota bacterium]
MSNSRLQVGFGKVEITPSVNCEMSGYVSRTGSCCGVHDPLWVRAIFLSDGETEVVIAATDLIGLNRETIGQIRSAAAQLTGVAPQQIMICAIHTHSGPVTLESAFLGEPDSGYLAELIEKVAVVILTAQQNRRPAQTFVGQSICREIGKNRRIFGGPTDSDVMVLRFEQSDGQKIFLVNYACHPVVLGPDNRLITADYPYYLHQELARINPGCESLFINGACGDINTGHAAKDSIHNPGGSLRNFATAERLGRILAQQVNAADESAVELTEIKLKIAVSELELDLEPLPTAADYRQQQLEWARQSRELKATQADYGSIRQTEVWSRWAQEMQCRAEAGNLRQYLTTEVAAIALGEIELVTFPGEFFHKLGMRIKENQPGKKVFILGYCNDAIGYVATTEAYAQGGYEVEDSYRYYGLPSRLAPGTGEQVVEAVITMLQKMRKEVTTDAT